MADLVGQTVAGYPLEKPLGTGAYYDLYQAQTSAEPVVLKALRPDLRRDGSLNEAIAAGWEAARAVVHPNLLAGLGAGVDPQHGAYCLQELLKAKPLRQMVFDGTKLAWRDVLEVAGQITAGLKALHDAGLTHGNLTPGNVLVTQDQDVKLEDAGGLSRVIRPVTDLLPATALGYLAPERLQGAGASPGADLYGLGACLYFVLAEHDPFSGRDVEVMVRAACEDEPPSVEDARTDIPMEGVQFLKRLLAKDPTQRYGKAGDVWNDLAALKEGRPLALLEGGPAAALPKPAPRAAAPAATPQTTPVPAEPAPALAVSRAEPPPAEAGPPRARPAPPSAEAAAAAKPGRGRPAPAAQAAPRAPAAGQKPGFTVLFGDLKTHVQSTIPQSPKEKEGDDLFRAGQLAGAMVAWRAAWQAGPQHPALQAKLERAERQARKQEFDNAMHEATLALGAKKFTLMLTHAHRALELADTPAQRSEATRIEADANVLVTQKKSLSGVWTVAMAFLLAALLLTAVALYLTGRRPATEPSGAPDAAAPAEAPAKK